jgi:hypothetical protein
MQRHIEEALSGRISTLKRNDRPSVNSFNECLILQG